MGRALGMLRSAAFFLLLLGTGLHLTVRDAWHPLSAVFYGLPLPVLAAGWLGLAVIQTRVMRLLSAAMVVFILSWWISISCKSNPVLSLGAPPLKVFFWNMAHTVLPSNDLAAIVDQERPDIATFVEVGRRHGDPSPLLASTPPGYQVLKLNCAMAIMVRGTASITRELVLPEDTKLIELRATVDGRNWKVIIADVVSSAVVSRKNSLATALNWAKDSDQTLVMGDFNTPLDSAFFDPWKLSMRVAFASSGQGLSETWPRWVPVLTLDHVWCGRGIVPLSTRKIWRQSSDHAALLVEISAPMASPPPPQGAR